MDASLQDSGCRELAFEFIAKVCRIVSQSYNVTYFRTDGEAVLHVEFQQTDKEGHEWNDTALNVNILKDHGTSDKEQFYSFLASISI